LNSSNPGFQKALNKSEKENYRIKTEQYFPHLLNENKENLLPTQEKLNIVEMWITHFSLYQKPLNQNKTPTKKSQY